LWRQQRPGRWAQLLVLDIFQRSLPVTITCGVESRTNQRWFCMLQLLLLVLLLSTAAVQSACTYGAVAHPQSCCCMPVAVA
jgi:hypothetical protein